VRQQVVEFCLAHVPGDEAEKAARQYVEEARADHGNMGELRHETPGQGHQP
jgi:hypothetical protein